MTQDQEQQLIAKIRKGDERAFEVLFNRYEAAIYRFCLLMVGDRDAAQDIHQDAFFRLYKTCRCGEELRSVYGWLMSAVRSRCHNYLRDQKRRSNIIERHVRPVASEPDFALNFDIQEHLRKALLQIPSHYREALLLYEVEGYTYKEIAEILECDFHQVKNRIYQGKKGLQKILTPIFNHQNSVQSK